MTALADFDALRLRICLSICGDPEDEDGRDGFESALIRVLFYVPFSNMGEFRIHAKSQAQTFQVPAR